VLIASFDGRNITLVVDALELKALNEVLRNAKPTNFKVSANALEIDGFHITEEDVVAYTRAAILILKPLMATITLKAEDEDEAGGDGEQEAVVH
jgi:hypothetical protein